MPWQTIYGITMGTLFIIGGIALLIFIPSGKSQNEIPIEFFSVLSIIYGGIRIWRGWRFFQSHKNNTE